MKTITQFGALCKRSASRIWEGFLDNIGVIIAAFLFSGGWIVAIQKFQSFRQAVRQIPTDWILTPLVLLVVLVGVLGWITYRQRSRLASLTRRPPDGESHGRFVTHLGVWWKVFDDIGYIEDFPYCPCCEPHKKLIQTEWYPDEVYRCPSTGTEVKLYDEVPRKRREILDYLYRAYCKSPGQQLEVYLFKRRKSLGEINPDKQDDELTELQFQEPPLSRLLTKDRDSLRQRFPNYHNLFSFLCRNFDAYADYLVPEKKNVGQEGQ